MKKSFSEKMAQLCLIAAMLICGIQCAFGQTAYPWEAPGIVISKPAPQKYPWKSQLKKSILPGSLALLSGAAGGLREGLHFRRTEFFRAFPKANRNYWDTNISSEVQPKFFGAARDGYHDAQYFHTGMLFASGASAGIVVAVPLIRKEKRPWWHTCVDIGIQGGASLAGYFIGSRLVYDVILHQ
jgi:hypothetical protein